MKLFEVFLNKVMRFFFPLLLAILQCEFPFKEKFLKWLESDTKSDKLKLREAKSAEFIQIKVFLLGEWNSCLKTSQCSEERKILHKLNYTKKEREKKLTEIQC